jgi:hypothetical protein
VAIAATLLRAASARRRNAPNEGERLHAMLSSAVPSLTPLTPESVVALAASADRLTALALLLPFRHRTVTNVMIGRALGELWLTAKASNRKHLDPGHILLVVEGSWHRSSWLPTQPANRPRGATKRPERSGNNTYVFRLVTCNFAPKDTAGDPPKFSTRSTW